MSDGMVVDVQDDIIEFEELFEWFPDTLVSIPQIDDGALPLCTRRRKQSRDSQLLTSTDHPFALLSAILRFLEYHLLGPMPLHTRADMCERHAHSLAQIRPAADDPLRPPIGLHLGDCETIGIGVLLEREDFPHAASFQVRPLYLHLLHFAYGSGDTICDRQRIRLFPVDEVAEPMEGNLHTDAAYTGSALRCRGFMGFLVFVPTSAASAKYHSRLPRKRSTLLFRLFPSPP